MSLFVHKHKVKLFYSYLIWLKADNIFEGERCTLNVRNIPAAKSSPVPDKKTFREKAEAFRKLGSVGLFLFF